MPSKNIDNKEIKETINITKKHIIIVIITILLITIAGTFAWLSWKSNDTALVLTVGDINSAQVILKPYQINSTITPVLTYENEEYTEVTATNNSTTAKVIKLFYKINNIDPELVNTNFKYTITKSTDNGSTYTEYLSGDFSTASTDTELYIMEEKLPESTTYKYKVYIWLYSSDENQTNIQGKSFNGELRATIEEAEPTGADMLIEKANASTLSYADATDSQKGEMWTFSHDATEQVEATTDYRYIGSSPNNYISFNDEVWRIIGVFDGRIKIIRNESLGDMYWDYKKSGVGSSTTDYGSNDWTDSQLMYMLNPTSYKLKTGYSLTDSKIYDGNSNIIYQLGCKPASIASGATSYSCTSNTWSLNSTALSQIAEATYYLGGSSSNSGHSATSYYTFERGTTVYTGRPTSWTGLVGLMYPSDYAYTFANGVDDKCYTDTYNCDTSIPSSSWLYKSNTYQWTVSPYSSSAYNVFSVFGTGHVYGFNARRSSGVRPVVYLKSDIKLQGGGTSGEPYEIVRAGGQPPVEQKLLTSTDLILNANPSTLMYSNATTKQKGEMWTFSHEITEQVKATTDYRYIGSSPNNYISFNDEVWRIIGVFDGRIKIIRNDSLGDMSWDYKNSGVGSSTSSSGSNDWTDSQLMYMLNPTSYTLKTGYSLTNSKIYDGRSNIIYQLGCKPASIANGATSYSCTNNTWSLNSTALSQISEATYYLGGSSSWAGYGASSYYTFERGTTVYSGRPTSWSGLVGLMYPSDYAYTFANGVDDTCYTNTFSCYNGTPSSSWLYKSDTSQWTVSPISSSATSVFYVHSTGRTSHSYVNSSYGVRPVVYLKSDIKLQGTGTSSDPYEIVETGADMLIKNANPSTLSYADATDSQKAEMWTFAHDATTQTSATTDYRYIGSSPNNYITFNDEVWRIIGVFDGRIKIIRNDTLGNMYWDYKQSGVGSSTSDNGSNDWSDSQLMYMLNPTSYTLKAGYSLTDGKIYDGSSNIIYQLGCKPASIASGATSYSCTSNTWSLNSTALSQISEATYYLGGSSSSSKHSASSYYAFERGTMVYSGRPTSWSGLVGLMYPSDYAYTFANGVDDKCYTDTYNCDTSSPSSSWLYKSGTYQWTVSTNSSDANSVFFVISSGFVVNNSAYGSNGVRPVVYLKSDIKLQGSGTSGDPYGIKE